MENSFTVRRLSGSQFYELSDETLTLAACPCCRKPFTEEAAQKLAQNLTAGWHGMHTLSELASFWDLIHRA